MVPKVKNLDAEQNLNILQHRPHLQKGSSQLPVERSLLSETVDYPVAGLAAKDRQMGCGDS